MRLKILLILISVLVYSIPSFSATYYVEQKGSAANNIADNGTTAWNNATSIDNPVSGGTAMIHAVAGDTTYFRGGTYELGQSDNNQQGIGMLYPRNSGTSDSNRIIFEAYPGETPILNTTVDGSIISRAWGDRGQDYTTLKGFTISSTGATYCGSVGIGNDSTYTVIDSCIFLGSSTPGTNSDNISGLAFEWSTNVTIKNCKFQDYRDSANNHNTSAIKTYTTNYLTVTNCEFRNCTVGTYDKRDNNNNTYKNSFYYNCYIGFFVTINTANAHNSSVYNNIFAEMTLYGSGIDSNVGAVSADNWSFYNNTHYNNSPRQLTLGYGSGQDVYNNVFVGAASEGQLRVHSSGTVNECDHNIYDTNINIVYDGTTYTDLSTWQNSGELEGSVDPGTDSINDTPVFVNTSGNMDEIADFALDTGSPGEDSDRSGNDMGADVSLVGVDAGSVDESSTIGSGDSSTFTSGDSTVIN